MPIVLDELPDLVRQFALYERNINGRSPLTVEEYCFDLRTFFRFICVRRGLVANDTPWDQIPIQTLVTLDLVRTITTTDLFEFMNYAADERNNSANTRARKTITLRGFFKYLHTHEKLIETNPAENLPSPRTAKSLPRFLSLQQAMELLQTVDGPNRERDYCILVLFLNCGMRLSELVGINLGDIQYDTNMIRITGKGNKQRMVYLNDACLAALKRYLSVRPKDQVSDREALFLSNRRRRISPKTVQYLVKKYLGEIGLQENGYSVHKLRHTAATLMYQYGDVDIRVLKEILGHENLGTTEIYTHVSDKQMEAASKANPLSEVRVSKSSKKDPGSDDPEN